MVITYRTDYVHDEHNNRAYFSHFGSQAAAVEALKSLKRCSNCTNCTDCTGCIGCTSCRDCTNCINCTSCTSCRYCTVCRGCNECDHLDACGQCYNARLCDFCTDCVYCTHCSHCTDCRNCNYLDNCSHCYNCSKSEDSENIRGKYYQRYAFSTPDTKLAAVPTVTLRIEDWTVTFSHETIRIGCQNHSIHFWRTVGEVQLRRMHPDAVVWYRKHMPTVLDTHAALLPLLTPPTPGPIPDSEIHPETQSPDYPGIHPEGQ